MNRSDSEKIPDPPKPLSPEARAVDEHWRSQFDEMRENLEKATADLKEATRRAKATLRRHRR